MLQRHYGDAGFNPAGGTKQVAHHRFGRRHGEALGVATEDRLERSYLRRIAYRCGGSMGVDVADRTRFEVGVRERRLDDANRAISVLGWRGDMVGIGGHAIADDLGDDLRATASGRLFGLENQDARTLAQDETVTLGVEWTARSLGSSLRNESARMR